MRECGLHGRTAGRGPDWLLLHGWGLHSGVWSGIEDNLTASRRVTFVDLPGHGRSRVEVPENLATVAADAAEWLQPDSVVMGWSLGGLLALRMALDWPESIAGLVLVATTPRFLQGPDWPHAVAPEVLEAFRTELVGDHRQTLNRFLALQARGSDTAREDTRWLREQVLEEDEPDPEGLTRGLEWLAGSDLRDELGGIAVPVHLIGGERDTLVPPTALEATAALLERARVSVIPGAGHAPFISHRAAFLETLELPHG